MRARRLTRIPRNPEALNFLSRRLPDENNRTNCEPASSRAASTFFNRMPPLGDRELKADSLPPSGTERPDLQAATGTPAGRLARHFSLSAFDASQVPRLQGLVVGADTRTRTEDLIITNDLLYQLSYIGTFTTVNGTIFWPSRPTLCFQIATAKYAFAFST
jgi:hypothetical protein